MKAMVFAETEQGARELCAGARGFAEHVVLVTLGEPVTGAADVCATIDVPEGMAKECAYETALAFFESEEPQIVFFEPTRRLKTIVGRIASHEGACVITDVIEFADSKTSSRYFGGIAKRTTKSLTPTAFCSVSAGAFDAANASGTEDVEALEFVQPQFAVETQKREPLPPAEVDLTKADIIVAAGRGFASQEDLELARTFTKEVGGELGCTRPLTEAEDWFPREAYIGVSGLMLSPKVYVGIGVSGQMQHMVGVDSAETLFAINKDQNAPIFKEVDYGLVGEIDDVMPKVNAKLA